MNLEEELDRLHDILNAPPFVQSPLERMLDQALELLGRLFGVAAPQGAGRWLAVLVGVIVAAAVLFFILRAVRATLVRDAQAARPPADGAPTTSAKALASAQQLAAAGDYRSAIRELFLAALIVLDERGLLRYDRSLTNRETLQRLARTNPELATNLGPVVEVFDRTWYGFAPIDAASFDAYRARVEALRDAAPPKETPR